MASQTAKEDQYLLEYERKSLEAKALAEKMSHLQERQNMVFLQRPLLARQHSNQVKQVRPSFCQRRDLICSPDIHIHIHPHRYCNIKWKQWRHLLKDWKCLSSSVRAKSDCQQPGLLGPLADI